MMKPSKTMESRRIRTQGTVGVIGFWILAILAVVLFVFLQRFAGWWIGGAAIGWGVANVIRSLIDAHYLIEETRA